MAEVTVCGQLTKAELINGITLLKAGNDAKAQYAYVYCYLRLTNLEVMIVIKQNLHILDFIVDLCLAYKMEKKAISVRRATGETMEMTAIYNQEAA
ncbi:hypothetical protein T07_14306 [Trichinella nelsoni]|uniref:Uncharacterized protein n=1 Tax=Trichinella nelsoni TaxID=6336 RepID=A0A0V0RWJ8_9BILA|nr:hypothetical protein T07_14306 [Trichinella nelsoni]